eukprot:TRINITY_DN7635_c0_g2_i4.p1 TRINITY_DN7635_c0_g2~~TRINITY_DN7635_c0_g2_i4.p1  ORF type:complete len:634 (+),score=89.27 TRINITY_DN7635_c0_g2_i4:421-2322(+)
MIRVCSRNHDVLPTCAPSGNDHTSAKYAKISADFSNLLAAPRRSPRLTASQEPFLFPTSAGGSAFSVRTPTLTGFGVTPASRKTNDKSMFTSPNMLGLPRTNGLNGFSLFSGTPELSPSIFAQAPSTAFMKMRKSPALKSSNAFGAFSPTVFLRSPAGFAGLKGIFPPLSDVPLEIPPSMCHVSNCERELESNFDGEKAYEDINSTALSNLTFHSNPFQQRPDFYNLNNGGTDHEDDDGKNSAHSSESAFHDDIYPSSQPGVQLTTLPPFQGCREPTSSTSISFASAAVKSEFDEGKDFDDSPEFKPRSSKASDARIVISREMANAASSAGSSCHQCKSRRAHNFLAHCQNRGLITESPNGKRSRMKRPCRKKFCSICLQKFYGEKMPFEKERHDWTCPACREICTCAACRKGKFKQSQKVRPTAPAEMLSPASSIATNIVYHNGAHCQNRGLITESPNGKRSRMKRPCRKKFCSICLQKFYGEKMPFEKERHDWTCPACREICTCAACRKGKFKQSQKVRPTAPAEMLSPASSIATNIVYHNGDMVTGLPRMRLDELPQEVREMACKAADYLVYSQEHTQDLLKFALPSLPEFHNHHISSSKPKGKPKLVSRRRQLACHSDDDYEDRSCDSE